MDRTFESIRQDALSLDSDKRSELLEELAESLATEPLHLDEWLDEIERRWKSIERGEAKLYSAEDVIAEARALMK